MSIPTNIAEGCARQSDPEFRRFLFVSLGSASELEYLLLLSSDLGYLAGERATALMSETQRMKRMLTGLINRMHPIRPTADSR
jgi:four helix bundle protein